MDGEEDRNGRNDAGAIIEDEGAQERRSEACEIKGSDVIRSGWTTKVDGDATRDAVEEYGEVPRGGREAVD